MPEVISEPMIKSAQWLLAHWDGLESGKRLRRAARRYRDATGMLDDIAAFQEAYVGLEAMEPLLASVAGLTPGTEEIKGFCEHCGGPFTRRRTSLVGVRAFVLGDLDADKADEQRKAEWNLINKLRNELLHGLVDHKTLKRRPRDALIASMHYLHDPISIFSHAPENLSREYRLIRSATQYVLAGSYTASSWSELSEWAEVVQTPAFRWVPHPTYGLVPELSFHNPGLKDLEIGVGQVVGPMLFATMRDIRPARVEID
jgi:hypothetical protein